MTDTFLIRNALRCHKCKSIAISVHVWGFSSCSCKAIAADGGLDYLRRVGAIEAYDELSIYGLTKFKAEIVAALTAGVTAEELLLRMPDKVKRTGAEPIPPEPVKQGMRIEVGVDQVKYVSGTPDMFAIYLTPEQVAQVRASA